MVTMVSVFCQTPTQPQLNFRFTRKRKRVCVCNMLSTQIKIDMSGIAAGMSAALLVYFKEGRRWQPTLLSQQELNNCHNPNNNLTQHKPQHCSWVEDGLFLY